MDKNPNEIKLAKLEVLVMPNGEILCMGTTIGYVKNLGKYLTDIKNG